LIRASPEIANNIITDADYGIYAEHSSPSLSNNVISEISRYGIFAKSGDSFKITNNTLTDSEMIFFDSTIKELWLIDSTVKVFNTTVEDPHLDETSRLEVMWLLHVRVTDDEGIPVEGAAVLVYDAYNSLISTQITDSQGWVEEIPVIEEVKKSTSTMVYNPYRIEVIKDSQKSTSTVTIEEDTTMVIPLRSEDVIIKSSSSFPWGAILLVGFFGAIGVGCISIEVVKYGLIALFLPLYSRIKKTKLLDQPTRERIYGYIIGNPGAHFGLIKDDLELGNGQLAYHLNHLKEAHMIYSREDGVKKRFYPADTPQPKGGIPNISDIQEKIFGIIKDNSGIGQKKIASSMGISHQVAGYHLKIMERKGLINREVVGRERRYYPSEMFGV
jgi:parallel beta-helix repeat protein